jgi:hypothetical protein
MRHPEDLIVWPDGTQCFRHELEQYTHMSDDYSVYVYDTFDWAFMLIPDEAPQATFANLCQPIYA